MHSASHALGLARAHHSVCPSDLYGPMQRTRTSPSIVIAIMTGENTAALWREHRATSGAVLPSTLCARHTAALSCVAYTDDDAMPPLPPPVMTVPPSAYLRNKSRVDGAECCRRSRATVVAETAASPKRKTASFYAYETERFFCDAHRVRTLSAQHRFLPALAHAKGAFFTAAHTTRRSAHGSSHERASGSAAGWAGTAMGSTSMPSAASAATPRWLVLVDDDSYIGFHALRSRLEALGDAPLYSGDLVDWSKMPYWRGEGKQPAFACGGAGTVLTR